MGKNVQRTILGILGTLALATGLLVAVFSHPAVGNPAPIESGAYVSVSSQSQAGFRIETVTDKAVYTDTETVLMAVRLLNESPFSIYVGIGPDEPTFTTLDPDDPSPMESQSLSIGYAILTPLDQPVVICTATVQPDGTVDSSCTGARQYPLSLYASNVVPGHSTGIISVLEMALDESSDSDEEDPHSRLPLEPGYYLLDCHINGIYETETARAQQIIEIRS